ncbi:MAG: hypothetical protein MJE68_02245, partial [Proteobacteria bacterium]|nr:hypothetical protein [Pseudomonadota bacterium]
MNGSTLIQGGRLRKTSRGIISFAPFLAGASVLALGALLATSSPVEAGSCSETGTTGMWTCTGAASGSNNDTQSAIRGRANQNVVVTGEAGFGFAGDGIKIDGITNSGTIDVNFTNSNNISSIFTGIDIYQPGTGAVTVATNGTIESSTMDGIEISQYGDGDVTVTTDGAVTGNLSGIEIFSTSGITGDINLTTNAAVTGDAEGIKLDVKGNSAVTVMATGTVTSSSTEEAIEIKHSGTGDVNLTTSDTVTATVASKDAIRVNHTGTGNITLTVNGSVVGGSSANAIDLSTASTSSNATIILGSGASFTGGIDVSGVMGDASIEVGGTGDRSFDIGDTPAITGDHNFDKNGDHT